MAFVREDEDEENQGLNGQPVATGPQSGIIQDAGGGGASSAPGAAKSAPDNPGNFVGIQQYLSANKPQAAKLGDQTAGIINQSAQNSQSANQALTQEAQEKIKPTNFLGDDVKNKINTTAEALTPEERANIKATQTAQYRGPSAATDLSTYQAANDAQSKASQNIQNSGTEQGRMGLISQINNKPRTQGMNVFDNALLQAGGGREKLAQAATANQGALTGLQGATDQIAGQIGRADDPNTPDVDESAGAIGQTNKAQGDAYKTVQDALSGWKSAFTPKVAQAQNDFTTRQQSVTNDIADNPLVLDPETLSLFNGAIGNGQSIYGLNLNDYLNPGSPSDINASNIASGTDYARYGALADLAGDSSNYLNPANASQAGTAPQFGANFAKLRNDIEGAQGAYNNAFANTHGGFLNSAYLPSDISYDSRLTNASPQEIESQWIPYYENLVKNPLPNGATPALNQQIADALKGSVNDFRKNQGAFNVVRPSNIPYPDDTLDWREIAAPTGGAGKEPPPIYNQDDEILKKKGVV